ncbi:MAG: Mur ligase family protein [Gammaproteobacteria bacterium]|nr:Mur ligase family protein [Gammaproteobacteria bacterium]
MEFLDARRLTGPNIFSSKAGAVLDIACTADEAGRLLPYCEGEMRRMLEAVHWGSELIRQRRLAGGVSIAISAPIDALYAASALCEWAWASCDAEFNGAIRPDFDETAAGLRQAIKDEVNPPLLELERAAARHGISFLWDDDFVSVGHGNGSRTWPFRELPDPDAIDWAGLHDVPVGIVTGTNGKTTTARIARHLLQSIGRTVGLSCTDWVSVNEKIIDHDDWSGPGGARMVLRQPDVDAAILETARGGLLRRGLGVNRADAALITNIAEDHLGDFGSRSQQELLDIKWVIIHAVRESGTLVLNADDRRLVEKSREFEGRISWFSLADDNPVVLEHAAKGGVSFVLSDTRLVRIEGERNDVLCAVNDIPITLDGAARHNVANSLAAAALTEAMGLTPADIARGLRTMSQDSNPGRSNLYPVDGFRVLVDFAHNPQAMQALFAMARALPAKRRALCFGQAGDRTDSQIRELARSAWSIGLDLAIISELEHYRRGREPGEVYAIIRDELLECGAREEQVLYNEEEADSFDAALEWAEPGDLVVILDLGRTSGIHETLAARS